MNEKTATKEKARLKKAAATKQFFSNCLNLVIGSLFIELFAWYLLQHYVNYVERWILLGISAFGAVIIWQAIRYIFQRFLGTEPLSITLFRDIASSDTKDEYGQKQGFFTDRRAIEMVRDWIDKSLGYQRKLYASEVIVREKGLHVCSTRIAGRSLRKLTEIPIISYDPSDITKRYYTTAGIIDRNRIRITDNKGIVQAHIVEIRGGKGNWIFPVRLDPVIPKRRTFEFTIEEMMPHNQFATNKAEAIAASTSGWAYSELQKQGCDFIFFNLLSVM